MMPQSFAAFAEGGDTQPFETQVYKLFTSSAVEPSPAATAAADAYRVDLASEWAVPGTQGGSPIDDEIDESHASPDILQVSQDAANTTTLAPPKTPAVAGQKRDARGEVIGPGTVTTDRKTSSTKTPGSELTSAMFGGGNANEFMTMTQAFNQTQAPSSPAPQGLRSDPVFDRPSPNFRHRHSVSSPPRTSPPSKNARANLPHTAVEPMEAYRTMQESQEERARRQLQSDKRRRVDWNDDDEDDLFLKETPVEKNARRLRERLESGREVAARIDAAFASRSGRAALQAKQSQEQSRSDGDFLSGDDIEIPRTSSRNNAGSRPLPGSYSSPLLAPHGATQEVPATASQPSRSSRSAPKATQATAIEDSQRVKPNSQKENDDPALPDESDWQADGSPLAQRINIGQSQMSVASTQPRQALVPKEGGKIMQSSPPTLAPSTYQHTATIAGEGEPGVVEVGAAPNIREDIDTNSSPGAPGNVQQQGSQKSLHGTEANLDLAEQPAKREGKHQSHTTSGDTNGASTLYQTAQSQQTGTQRSTTSGRSPHLEPTRTLTDIAAESTPKPSSEQVDLENVNIVTADDEEFAKVLSGSSPVRPSRKRRAVYSAATQRLQPEPAPATDGPQSDNGQPQEQELVAANSPSTVERREQQQSAPEPSSPHSARDAATRSKSPEPRTRRTGPPGNKRLREVAENLPAASGTRSRRASSRVALRETSLSRTTRSEAKDRGLRSRQGNYPALGGYDGANDDDDTDLAKSSNRVLALCRDIDKHYWAATCTGQVREGRLRIVFDDGTKDHLDSHQVRRLELRSGDVVKLDLPAMKDKQYVVQNADSGNVCVVAKPRGRAVGLDSISSTPLNVSVSQIYVTRQLWPQFDERLYDHVQTQTADKTPSTPKRDGSTAPVTPSSRTRRAAAANSRQGPTSRLFANMAFAVSLRDDKGTEKQATLTSLADNGAVTLDSDFDKLYVWPQTGTAKRYDPDEADPLQLSSDAQDYGFVALITDTHSRRPKFLQALALGLPCLHHRWVSDCVADGRIHSWQNYLLPAGESTWLGGAVKSRVLTSYDPERALLAAIVDARPRLVGKDGASGVLMIGARGKKASDDRRKRFVFLVFAMGARDVRLVKDIAEAKAVMRDEKAGYWKWVHVEGEIGRAEKLLWDAEAQSPGATLPRVVNDEFLIQSLILGAPAV